MPSPLQIAAIPVLLVTALIGCSLSNVLLSQRSLVITAVVTLFSSGVLLAGGLVHMLPEATKNAAIFGTDFPVCNVLCGVAFVLLVAAEVAFAGKSADPHQFHSHAVDHHHFHHTHVHRHQTQSDFTKAKPAYHVVPNPTYGAATDHEHLPLLGNGADKNSSSSSTTEPSCEETSTDTSLGSGSSSRTLAPVGSIGSANSYSVTSTVDVILKPPQKKRVHISAVVVLLISLMSHGVIEGLVLGLEKSAVAAAGVFVAIISHKIFAAMALGATVRNSHLARPIAYTCYVLFSSATPLGVAIGLQLEDTSTLAVTVLQSLAAGAFLYLGGWHLVQHAMEDMKSPWTCRFGFAAYGIGFGLMSALALWA